MDADLANRCRAVSLEYETQYFGFSPKAFVDSVYNTMQENFEACLAQSVEKKASDADLTLVEREELDTEAAQLKNRMNGVYHSSFAKLEKYLLGHVFKIPEHVSLEEDKIHEAYSDVSIIEKSEKIRKQSYKIEHNNKEIRQTMADNAHLRAEIERVKQIEKQIDQLIEAKKKELSAVPPDVDQTSLVESNLMEDSQ